MSLDLQQQEHLITLYLAARELTEEIEAAAVAGIIRDGSGRLTTPLPEREWSAIDPRLRQFREMLHQAVLQHAGDLLRQGEERTSVDRTRAWIDARIGELEELLQDLQPKAMARRSDVIDAEAAASLEAAASDARSSLWSLRRGLELEEPGTYRRRREATR